MSNWKVSKEKIEIFDHPDAEKLQLGKVGSYQVVVQKGLYNGGEEVLFAPEKSVLTGYLKQEFEQYLAGSDKNRVKSIALRGMLSCGIILSNELVLAQCGKNISELPEGEDLSLILGITKYVPSVPTEMEGVAEPIEYDYLSRKHDVEQFGVYSANFLPGERVVITEKLHGSQMVAYIASTGNKIHRWVSTKNYNAEGLCLKETESNFYWRALRNIGLFDIIQGMIDISKGGDYVIQVFGEAIPCQSYKYGQDKPTMKIFGVYLNGEHLPHDTVSKSFKDHWVPILYDGPYENVNELRKLAKGKELVSGTQSHPREGIVIRPYIDRRATDGTWLKVKVINPEYKETGEEFN